MTATERTRLAGVLREIALRENDPLRVGLAKRTARQAAFIRATHREKIAEGGNQSGKTDSTVIDLLLEALGLHPTLKWALPANPLDTWRGWFSTTTSEKFSEQAWKHFKNYLFFEGESAHRLPSRRVLAIAWDQKSPETPNYMRLRRADGREAEIWVKSYKQGAGEFQAAEVNKLVLDEECPDSIWMEAQPRVMKRGGQIVISATPVLGVKFLEDLRAAAEAGNPDVFHTRFPTGENPGMPASEVAILVRKFAAWPAILKLRLEGFPLALEGKILPDTIFSRQHIVKPFLPPPAWTRYRCIDPGVNVCACLWAAVAPGRKKIVFYREHYGEDLTPTIDANARRIIELSREDGGESSYVGNWIDPAALGRTNESGERAIDLFNRIGRCLVCGAVRSSDAERCTEPGCHGARETLALAPAPDNRVLETINMVQALMAEKGADGFPLVGVCQNLGHFMSERRTWEWEPVSTRTDVVRERRIANHLMACLRYLVGAGLEHIPARRLKPPEGTMGRRLLEKRRKEE